MRIYGYCTMKPQKLQADGEKIQNRFAFGVEILAMACYN